MTKKENMPEVKFEEKWLTISVATNVKLENPDIVKELQKYSRPKLKENSEGKPIIEYKKVYLGLIPSPSDVENAQKEIEEFEDALLKTDAEVGRIKLIVGKLLEKEAGDEDKQ